MTKINILKKITNSIVVANNDFIHFKKENKMETNNAFNFMRNDFINSHLSEIVNADSSNLELLRFKKGNWEIRLIVDHSTKSIYSILNNYNFNRNIFNNSKHHYIKTMVTKHNKKCIEQLSFVENSVNEIDIIDNEYLDIIKDCNKSINGYTIYTILYTVEYNKIKDVCVKLLDSNLNIIESTSLNEYIESHNFIISDEDSIGIIKNNNSKNNITNYSELIPEKLVKLKTKNSKEKNM